MKLVILAGGRGTRISEETLLKPKPLVEIGGLPIIWHIMKIYSSFGFNDFVICCGYKGYMIKEYFANYFLHMSDIQFKVVVFALGPDIAPRLGARAKDPVFGFPATGFVLRPVIEVLAVEQ